MSWARVLAVGIAAGFIFAVLDGLQNANPVAQRLYAAYKPITRESVNAPLGVAFDLVLAVVMAFLFVLLAPALPGGPLTKGLAFGGIAWFFRVAMGVAGQAVMFKLPAESLIYSLVSGLAEMAIIGAIYGFMLRQK